MRRDLLAIGIIIVIAIIAVALIFMPPAPTPTPSLTPTTTSSPATTPGKTTTSSPPPTTTPEKKRPTLVVGVLQNIQNLDPALTKLSDDANVYSQIYEGLLEYDPQTGGLKGCLAESYEVSPDGKVYTFHIRKGVKFHDGTPLNASAVKFSMERVKEGPGKGYYMDLIEKIEVVDDYTLRVTLKMPFPPFEWLMAGIPKAVFYITSPSAVKKYGNLTSHPVGTGPYKFVEWVKDDHVTLEANDDYWKGPPEFERIVIKIFPDPQTARLALEKGEIDLLYDGLGVTPATDLDYYKSSDKFNMIPSPKNTIVFLFFWLPDPDRPTANPYLRKAIAHAINYDAIINKLLHGYSLRPYCYIVPTMKDYYFPVLEKYTYNLTKAKEYIEKSGLKTPIHLVAGYYSRATIRRDIFLMMKEDLKEIGIDIEIRSYELSAWMETYTTGANDIQISAWTALYFDPHGFASFFLNSSIPYPNNAHYYNPEYEQIVMDALKTRDPKERAQLYKKAWEILAEDLPAIPLYTPYTYWITQKYITGIPENYPLQHMYLGWLKKKA
ncbi:MAG: ABC transporter substrate-binding protein [Candidatus Korarchaeota archaeon]|nr:ABC transporter substrate-binding protein [Candidatus Korarchaeota archaeon]